MLQELNKLLLRSSIESTRLEVESKEWLASFCRLLGIKPTSIDLVTTNTGLIQVSFKNEQDAALFKRFLPRAGALIPFVPAQLELSPESASNDNTNVFVQRNIALQLNPSEIDQLFHFTPKLWTGWANCRPLSRHHLRSCDANGIGHWRTKQTGLQMAAIVNHGQDSRL